MKICQESQVTITLKSDPPPKKKPVLCSIQIQVTVSHEVHILVHCYARVIDISDKILPGPDAWHPGGARH